MSRACDVHVLTSESLVIPRQLRQSFRVIRQRLSLKPHVVTDLYCFDVGEVVIVYRRPFVLARRWAIAHFTPSHDAFLVDDSPLHRRNDLFPFWFDGAIRQFCAERQ
jgi:hypothetical protein